FGVSLTEVLAECDDAMLAAYVGGDSSPPETELRAGLAEHTARADVHPVLFGSAITGAGVDALQSAIATWLPAREGARDAPLSGIAFKMERGAAGERIAFVRLFAGTLHTRERVRIRGAAERTVTSIRVFDAGSNVERTSASAGQIAKLTGLGDIRIGDVI